MKSMFIFKYLYFIEINVVLFYIQILYFNEINVVLFVLQITKLPLSLYFLFVLEAHHDCNKVYAIYSYLCSLNISSFGSSY